jgi:hypothetical protein
LATEPLGHPDQLGLPRRPQLAVGEPDDQLQHLPLFLFGLQEGLLKRRPVRRDPLQFF